MQACHPGNKCYTIQCNSTDRTIGYQKHVAKDLTRYWRCAVDLQPLLNSSPLICVSIMSYHRVFVRFLQFSALIMLDAMACNRKTITITVVAGASRTLDILTCYSEQSQNLLRLVKGERWEVCMAELFSKSKMQYSIHSMHNLVVTTSAERHNRLTLLRNILPW